MEGAVRAEFLRSLCQRDGLRRGVCSGASNDLHATLRKLDSKADYLDVLIGVEGGGFPGGAYGNDAVDATCDLSLDQRLVGCYIDFSMAERGDKGGVDAGEVHFVRNVRDVFALG